MALLKLGPMVADIRGSIGGVVFARNAGGAYARNRTSPLNPNTTRQVVVRARLSNLANKWATELTPTQRQTWEDYAAAVPLPNSLGENRNVSGIAMYIRANSLLLDTGFVGNDNGPTELTLGPTIIPTYTLDAATNEITVYTLGGFDTVAQNVGVLFQASPPKNSGVNFLRSPFRKFAGVAFTAATPSPAVPATAAPFTFAVGQAVFIRSATVTPDGRVGVPVIQRFLAA